MHNPPNINEVRFTDNYTGSIKPYIIATTQRSGSTLLCDLLIQTGVCGQPTEYLKSELVSSMPELQNIYPNTNSRKQTREYLDHVFRCKIK